MRPLRATQVGRHPRAALLIASAVVAILAVTLFPVEPVDGGTTYGCVICGSRGVADAALNILLFTPLGVGLAMTRGPVRICLFASTLLSAGIELAQLAIPGRDPSIGDVLFNSLGAGVGMLVWLRRGLLVALGPIAAAGLSPTAAAAGVAVWTLTGVLLQPAFPPSTYHAHWTPNLGHLEWYRGRVLSAAIGDEPLPAGSIAERRSVTALARGAPLEVVAVAGPRPRALAALFSISDGARREVLLVGPDPADLVFRYRTRGTEWRLDRPDLRLPRALSALAVGDTMRITIERGPRGFCLALNAQRRCGLGYTIGHGWTLLLYPEQLPSGLRRALGALWIAMLTLPVGYGARHRWGSAMGVAILFGAAVAVPPIVGLLPTPGVEWLGLVGGLLVGVLLHLVSRRASRAGGVTPTAVASASRHRSIRS